MNRSAYFLDRDTGEIWCDTCVPAEVCHLTTPSDAPSARRFKIVEAGELFYQEIKPADRQTRPGRVRARCHTCGNTQPPGDVR